MYANNLFIRRLLAWLYQIFSMLLANYLRQVNEVNGRDTVFVRCGSVCLSVCVQRNGQSDQFKTVKATDFKFDVHVPRESPDMIP